MTDQSNAEAFFSIVTVTMNAAKAIQETAESIRMQSESDYEWIIVDGASDDETCEMAMRYWDPNRDTLLSEPDDGVFFAMNKGLTIAGGRYVVFLNAGDRFHDSETLSSVKAACNEQDDVIHGDAIFNTPHAGEILRRSQDSGIGMSRRVFASHQSVFIRRSIHQGHPFDTRYRFAADYAVFAQLHNSGFRFHYLPVPLSITTVDESSLSVKNRPVMAWEDYQINLRMNNKGPVFSFCLYLYSLIRILAVKTILSLPSSIYRLIPGKLRRKVY